MNKAMPKLLCGLLAICLSTPALAGGPLVLEGPNGHVPAKYENPDIIFNIETGSLGITRPNDLADQLVRNAMAIWNNIPTSNISITQGPDVPVDIDVTNFSSYIPAAFSSPVQHDNDGLNPIVYDDDGSIIDAFFGEGQGTGEDGIIVGFAASSIFIGSSFFTEGFAVINGNLPQGFDQDLLSRIIAHEIGHYFGLDHSQTNVDNTEMFVEQCPASDLDYPLMYPYACRNNTLEPTHADDNVSLSMLYPADAFYQNQGQLTGTFVTADGVPVKGANLWVENTQTPGEIYSIVSDYLMQCSGFFALMLPPGNYTLHANSVNREFYEGSSVGPYANCPTDFSFQSPASDIGANLVFTADGAQQAIISLEAGKSAEVVFRTDGSGSLVMRDTQIDLTDVYNSANACSASSACFISTDGGGGSPSLPLLITLIGIPALRVRLTRLITGLSGG